MIQDTVRTEEVVAETVLYVIAARLRKIVNHNHLGARHLRNHWLAKSLTARDFRAI